MKNLNNLVHLIKYAAEGEVTAKPNVDQEPSPDTPAQNQNNLGGLYAPLGAAYVFRNLNAPYLEYFTGKDKMTDLDTINEVGYSSDPNIVPTEKVPVHATDASHIGLTKYRDIATLNRHGILYVFDNNDTKETPLTLGGDPVSYFANAIKTLPRSSITPSADKAWYLKLSDWAAENPWTAGLGALGLGGIGYYLLSDDEDEEDDE